MRLFGHVLDRERAPVVVVVGMHRSGTSLCANMLQELGVDMAETPGVSPENARGHWERPRINDLNDRVFAMFGRGWGKSSHALALPENWHLDPRVVAVRGELTAWLRPLVASERFGFKDPRTARLFPMWRLVFDDLQVRPRFIFCVRDPAQVARSISARDQMARAQAAYRWLVYNADAVAGLGSDPVCIVPYEDWFTQPEQTARRLAGFVGAPSPPPSLARTMVDPALRHDASIAEPPGGLAPRLHGLIRGCVAAGRLSGEALTLACLAQEFQQDVKPLLMDMEVLRVSVADQNRVIGDLTAALHQARAKAA